MKYISIILALSISSLSYSQCDSIESVLNGTFITNSASNAKIQYKRGSDIPKIGEIIKVSKHFETKIFGMTTQGWMSIADAKVTATSSSTIQIKVIKETSNVVKNGKKVNQFAKGNVVKAEWKTVFSSKPILKMDGADTLKFSEMKCGVRHGWTKVFYPGNILKSMAYYKNDIPNGKYTMFTETGSKIESGVYTDNKINGLVSVYAEDGKVIKTVNMKNSKQNGITSYYKFGNDVTSATETFKNGKLEGEAITYFKNGKPKFTRAYNSDQKIDGAVFFYYENGNLEITRNIDNGENIGFFKEYYEDGTIHFDYNVAGKLYDKGYKSYYKNGQLEAQGEYAVGNKIGNWKKFYENGNMKSDINYINDKFVGEFKTYSENGNLIKSGKYSASQKLIGEYKEYYSDGKPKVLGLYSTDGEKTGKWTLWDEQGKKTKEKF